MADLVVGEVLDFGFALESGIGDGGFGPVVGLDPGLGGVGGEAGEVDIVGLLVDVGGEAAGDKLVDAQVGDDEDAGQDGGDF